MSLSWVGETGAWFVGGGVEGGNKMWGGKVVLRENFHNLDQGEGLESGHSGVGEG